MNGFSRVFRTALFELSSAIRSRRALVTVLMFALIGAGVMFVTVSVFSTLEEQVISTLGLPAAENSGGVTMTLWRSSAFKAMMSKSLDSNLLFNDMLSQHPVALAFAFFVFGVVPLMTLITCAPTAAGEIRSGSVRYVLLRVSRTEWTLGLFSAEALVLLFSMMLLAAAAAAVALYRLPGWSALGIVPSLFDWALRAWVYSLSWLGICTGASMCVKSPGKATGFVNYVTPYMEASFPEIQGNYDPANYTDPNHPLYKFVAYHILPEQIAYGEFNVTNKEPEDILSNFVKRSELDIEDFYESYLPHALMRISSPERPANIFINRKGVNPVEVEGVKIMNDSIPEPSKNGVYYYIDKLLMYDLDTRNIALNTRLRYDAMTLSPDFINSGARNRKYVSTDPVSTAFKNGFVKNFKFNSESKFYVRYRNRYFSAYEGDDMSFKGIYDITLKLPPIPASGTYEVRLGYFAMKSRGVVQIYFGDSEENNGLQPCGIPLDLRIIPSDPKIGWLSDSGDELNDNEDKIAAYDKAMRSRGYMKAPDCYASSNTTLREQGNARQGDGSMSGAIRRILVTQYLDCNTDYFVRFRQVLDNDQAEFQFDYLELVPKSVYAGTTPEDRH